MEEAVHGRLRPRPSCRVPSSGRNGGGTFRHKRTETEETGQEEGIIIARYGKPIVKIVRYNNVSVSKRIGVAKGRLKSPENLDKYNDEIAKMFGDRL